jgi:hypothetical protein
VARGTCARSYQLRTPAGLKHRETPAGILQGDRQAFAAVGTPIHVSIGTTIEADGRMQWERNHDGLAESRFVILARHVTGDEILIEMILHRCHTSLPPRLERRRAGVLDAVHEGARSAGALDTECPPVQQTWTKTSARPGTAAYAALARRRWLEWPSARPHAGHGPHGDHGVLWPYSAIPGWQRDSVRERLETRDETHQRLAHDPACALSTPPECKIYTLCGFCTMSFCRVYADASSARRQMLLTRCQGHVTPETDTLSSCVGNQWG